MIFCATLQQCCRTNWSLRGNSRTNWSNLMEYYCILLARSQHCMRACKIYYYTVIIQLINLKILVMTYFKRRSFCGPISNRQLGCWTILKKIRVWLSRTHCIFLRNVNQSGCVAFVSSRALIVNMIISNFTDNRIRVYRGVCLPLNYLVQQRLRSIFL